MTENVLTVDGFDDDLRHTIRPDFDKTPAAPFIKWAGGKRAIMAEIASHFPEQVSTYWEPFVGGGAVFFAMADRIDRAILCDTNKELITTYNVVKDQVENLIDRLKHHAHKHKCEDYYLRVRSLQPSDAIEVAARFIYLNKTCYNGLYRVNRGGQFNVPKGRYKNPTICDEVRLRTASHALAKATIKLGDFENTVEAGQDHFIYCDPPYDDCFTNYQAGGFNAGDQERLRDAVDRWIASGAKVMVSNSSTPLINKLYQGKAYHAHTIKAPRAINSNASGRGAVAEVIITSYGN